MTNKFDRFLSDECEKPDFVSMYSYEKKRILFFYIDRSNPDDIKLIEAKGAIFGKVFTWDEAMNE